jgi:oligoendopeptidase F
MLEPRNKEEPFVETTAPPLEETWNLTDLYADDDAFAAAKQAFQERLPQADAHKGSLLSSASALADALDAVFDSYRELHTLHSYASLKSDVDTRVGSYQAMRQEIRFLSTELSKRTSYLRPEILAGEPETLLRYLDQEPRLAPYRHFVQDLLRQRDHVLPPGEERLMAEAGLVRGQASSLYGLFTNAELPRPEVQLASGDTIRLTPVEFQKQRLSSNREDRSKVYPAYFSAYTDFRGTLGQNLYSVLKEHLFESRARGYGSCLETALDADNVPQSVYRNLIAQVHEALPVLHRYFRLRARFLGQERLEYFDLACPLIDTPPLRYTTEQARRLVTESLEPLGSTYGSALEEAFRSRWIDWHPGEGKRSGAYAAGSAYDVHPYVLLNYNDDYDNVSTLAHEMGHAMHSHFSNATQPYATSDYSIFVAEVASTFNEALLLRRVLETADTREAKLFVVASFLDGIRGTLFRQTMFAEFELEIHERTERGEVLTGERLDEIYLELLRRYHGHDAGVVNVAETYAVEWAAVPHFYYDFYVYQYATGIVAAGALSRMVLADKSGARERYLSFLHSGGSDYPLELLRAAGVDLEDAAPYRDAFATVDGYLDQLEALLDETSGANGR